jgi:hypothetical protein
MKSVFRRGNYDEKMREVREGKRGAGGGDDDGATGVQAVQGLLEVLGAVHAAGVGAVDQVHAEGNETPCSDSLIFAGTCKQ